MKDALSDLERSLIEVREIKAKLARLVYNQPIADRGERGDGPVRQIVRGVKAYDGKTDKIVLIDVDVDIDVARVAQMLGRKAFKNVSRKSTEMSGAVKVTVRKGETHEHDQPVAGLRPGGDSGALPT